MKIKKALIYLVLAILSLILGVYSPSVFKSDVDESFLKTSMFEIMNSALINANKIIDEVKTDKSDLSLEKVSVRKNGNKYIASYKIKNEGVFVKDLSVIIGNNISKEFVFVKNSGSGLSLNKGEEYVSNDFIFEMDKQFSGAEIVFYIKILNDDVFETNSDNNFFKIDIGEKVSTIDDFFIEKINKDHSISFDYKLNDFLIYDKSYEILISNKLDYLENEKKYREIIFEGKIFPYNEIPLSEDVFASGNFKSINSITKMPVNVQVLNDLFINENESYYLVLKIYYKSNSSVKYKYSNIIDISPVVNVSKSDLQEILKELSGFDADISELKEGYLSRADAVKYIFDFFEIEIEKLQSKKIFFKDLSIDDPVFPYAQALKKFEFANNVSDIFASKDFINRELLIKIINECKKYN